MVLVAFGTFWFHVEGQVSWCCYLSVKLVLKGSKNLFFVFLSALL